MPDDNIKVPSDPVPPGPPAGGEPVPAPPSHEPNRPPADGIVVPPAPLGRAPTPAEAAPAPRAEAGVTTARPEPARRTGPLRRVGRFFWPAQQKSVNQPPVNTTREVLDTVVFVVVLVVLLKSFVAEAFVIPTGSMATTLLGYHKNITCPQCGAEFPVNCSDEVEKPGGGVLSECTCYNCRYKIDFDREKRRDADWSDPSAVSGDRVLVAKFLSDLRLMPFKPLDVVVFKFPEQPLKNHVPTNYIKRLIGMPEQTIGIYYGDIYVAAKDDLIKKGVSFEPTPEEKDQPVRLRIFKNRAKELLEAGDPVFRMLRKPPDKVLALRRPVYDNDHQAKDLIERHFPPRWAPEMDGGEDFEAKRKKAAGDEHAWRPFGAKGFEFRGRSDGQTAWLRYRNILRDETPNANPRPELITDFLSYNSGNTSRSTLSSRWVGDLLLECRVKVEKAEGDLVVELSKGLDRFQARWQLATGLCTLLRNGKELANQQTRLTKPGMYDLRFANVDRRLTVWVDNALPFEDGVAYDAPRTTEDGVERIYLGPTANDLEPVGVGARGGAALTVQRLKLWRDTYYTAYGRTGADDIEVSADQAAGKAPAKWLEVYKDQPGMTMYVQPGHYLCLGDNSPASSDSRIWGPDSTLNRPATGGLVPERLMLGRALLVYFPFSRAGRIK